MSEKLNEHNYKLKSEDLQPVKQPGSKKNDDTKIDVSLLIEKNKILLGNGDKCLSFNKLVKNTNNYQKYKNFSSKFQSPCKSNKSSFTRSASMSELNIMEKYRHALQTPFSQAKT